MPPFRWLWCGRRSKVPKMTSMSLKQVSSLWKFAAGWMLWMHKCHNQSTNSTSEKFDSSSQNNMIYNHLNDHFPGLIRCYSRRMPTLLQWINSVKALRDDKDTLWQCNNLFSPANKHKLWPCDVQQMTETVCNHYWINWQQPLPYAFKYINTYGQHCI